MIIDTITYNGEKELFEIRYNILKDYVDEFIVVEFDKTFSGKPKDFSFPTKYKVLPKVNYSPMIEQKYIKYKDLAENSPNTKGAKHWKLEFMQKESIRDCLTHLKDDDIVFVGDCDEIWSPGTLPPIEIKSKNYPHNTGKLKLIVYTYWLNNRSSEKFYGTLVGKYKYIKNVCLNHLRGSSQTFSLDYSGWHFTSMHHQLAKKLEDSYTRESYATPEVMANLESNIKNNRDFLGRDFTYKIDESEWPQYLKDNRSKYLHLIKQEYNMKDT